MADTSAQGQISEKVEREMKGMGYLLYLYPKFAVHTPFTKYDPRQQKS